MRHLEVLFVFAMVWQVSFSQFFHHIGKKIYHIENEVKLDWYDAREDCISMDAHLVSIKTLKEWNAITDELNRYKSYWVDIKDKRSDYNFISYTTGRKAPYLKWSRGQPSEGDCVKLWAQNHNMKTYYCSQENHYICEKNTRRRSRRQLYTTQGNETIDLNTR